MIYITILVLLICILAAYFRLAYKLNIVDKPNERSSHTGTIIRGGGIVFYFSILLYSLSEGFPYPWFLAGLTMIAVISFADDIKPVSSRLRLIIHFTAMLLMFFQWGLLTGMPWLYIVFALILCTGIINAYNFMDGINGITGGYSLVVLVALAFINSGLQPFSSSFIPDYTFAPFIDPLFLHSTIIGVLIFNFFNFRTKARCFAGDVGSVSIAFIILFALGRLILITGDLSYLIFLVIYGVDSILTIIHRLILGENIFKAHRKHAYQLLANELKWPHIGVSGLYMLLQSIIILGYLMLPNTPPIKWVYFAIIIVILAFSYIVLMKRKFYLYHR